MEYYVGIDLGGTNIAVGVVDEAGKIVAKHNARTQSDKPFEKIVADIAETAYEAVKIAGLSMAEIQSVGVGTPSCIHPATGLLLNSHNLGWKNVPFSQELEKHFAVPLYIKNDADCAALGEVIAGAAKDYDHAVMLTLGTGVGGGIILNGEIFSGCDHMGAEIGHIKLVFEGERCTCGQCGCLEAYASSTALINQTKAAIEEHPESAMLQQCGHDLSAIDARTSFEAARLGDEAALKVVDQYISYLAAGISSCIALFRPQVVIIGGGVSNEGDYLLKPLNEKIESLVYSAQEMGVPPAVAATLGNDAGIIGAAMLGSFYKESRKAGE